jgi:hypothetical protein
MVLGCTDGYLRFFDTSSANDVETNSSTAIDSYVSVGPQKLSGDDAVMSRLESLTITSGGSVTSPETTQSGPIKYEVFAGNSAEDVIDQIKGDVDATVSGTTSTGEGRKAQVRTKARGVYSAVRLSNDNLDETFAIEKVTGVVTQAGRAKI